MTSIKVWLAYRLPKTKNAPLRAGKVVKDVRTSQASVEVRTAG